MKDFFSIFEALVSSFENNQWDKGLLVLLMRKSWKEIVGEFVAQHSSPLKIAGDDLIIEVDNNLIMQQMALQQELIKERIKQKFQVKLNLKFILGRIRRRTPAKSKNRLDSERIREMEDMASKVKDPELRGAILKAMISLEEARLNR